MGISAFCHITHLECTSYRAKIDMNDLHLIIDMYNTICSSAEHLGRRGNFTTRSFTI